VHTLGSHPGVTGALLLLLSLVGSVSHSSPTGRLPVEEFELANGMRFLLLERPAMPTIEAGWVVGSGAADDPEGSTGISHFIEHMMFKGTRSVGSHEIDRELTTLDRLAKIEEALAEPSPSGRKAARRRSELESEQAELEQQARNLSQLGAFSLEYSRLGATRLNANTAEDLTLYYVTLPAEVVELWFWLESDRLLQPVFREFKKEQQVVAEERRRRVDSTPTGAADLQFDTNFWRGTSYSKSPLGRPADVSQLRRAEVADFFAQQYRPAGLTAVLVGNFDPGRIKRLAQTYFGRLGSQASSAASVGQAAPTNWEPERSRQEALDLTCECPPQVKIRYPTVPFSHPDQHALQLAAGLLNGRSGRLYRQLVLGQEIAFAAFAQQTPLRYAGSFTVTIEAKGGTSAEALLSAWDEEVARLSAEPPTEAELTRVKRRLATESLNQLKDPHLLMRRLLVYAGLGDWSQLADWTEHISTVRPEAVTDVAERYLNSERRLVGSYRRAKAGE